MAQHDYDLVDAPTLTIRSEFNSILAAVLSSNSGPIAPVEIYGGELWFNSSTGVMSLRNSGNSAWAGVPVDVDYLPVSGGTLSGSTGAKGNLTVNGTFSNPGYDASKGNFVGAVAPSNPVAGMLWYDTSVTPNVLRIRNKTNASWLTAIDMATPVFADSMTVTATGSNNAQVALTSSGTTRYIINEYGNDRFNFYLGGTGTMAFITDGGDLGLKANGYVSMVGLINGKQAKLGYTPIRQTGGNVPAIGGNPARLYVDGVDQGAIVYGPAPLPLLNRADIASFTFATTTVALSGNQSVGGGSLNYYPDSVNVGTGTWRNMQGALAANVRGIFQRIG